MVSIADFGVNAKIGLLILLATGQALAQTTDATSDEPKPVVAPMEDAAASDAPETETPSASPTLGADASEESVDASPEVRPFAEDDDDVEPSENGAAEPSAEVENSENSEPENIAIGKLVIVGQLRDPAPMLHKFFWPVVRTMRSLSSFETDRLTELSESLGYEIQSKQLVGNQLSLTLRPVLRVRHINVDVKDQSIGASFSHTLRWIFTLGQMDKADIGLILREDIEKRIRLRPGSIFPHDKVAQQERLTIETAIVVKYFRQQGFGDVKVSMASKKRGKWQVEINISIDRGERYRLGTISPDRVRDPNVVVTNREIREEFDIKQRFLRIPFGNKPFTTETLREGLEKVRKLYHEEGYPGVRVTGRLDEVASFNREAKTIDFPLRIDKRRKVEVQFIVVDNPNANVESLKNVLTFASESAYDEYEAEQSAIALTEYYQKRGRFDVTVEWRRDRSNQASKSEKYTFLIREGREAQVSKILFTGNKALKDGFLADQLQTKIYGLLNGGFVTKSQLEQDRKTIASTYREKGYLNVKVRSEIARRKELLSYGAAIGVTLGSKSLPNGVNILFHIDEGPKSIVEEVRIESLNSREPLQVTTEKILSRLKLKKGVVFNPTLVKKESSQILSYLGTLGFQDAKVETTLTSNGNKVFITHAIKQGKKMKVGEVAIRGNFKTEKWIIEDELSLSRGQTLTTSNFDSARQRLRATGLFRSIELKEASRSSTLYDTTANLVLNLQEASDYIAAFEFALGYTSDLEAVFAKAATKSQNMFGLGIRGNVSAESALDLVGDGGFGDYFRTFVDYEEYHEVESTFEFPQWLSRRTVGLAFNTELTGFLRQRRSDRFGALRSFGSRLRISRTIQSGLLRNWQIGLRYAIRQWNRDEDLIRPSGANEDLLSSPIRTRTESFGLNVIIDKRKKGNTPEVIAPDNGYRLEVNVETATEFLFGESTFVKFGASLQNFWSIKNRAVVGNYLRYNHGVPLGGAVLLPAVERFFAGGNQEIRGIEEDRALTEILSNPLVGPAGIQRFAIIPTGGNIRFIHNLDVQIQLFDILAGVMFIDTAIVTNSLDGFKLGDLRHGVGIGIRSQWDLLPFSLEYAVPIDPVLGDDPRGRLHFRIGLVF